ncbi:virion protein [Haloarcula virus Hardyhisp2]|uniref:Virion protein n=1 Tax=Haloarcula virus Hardyhisp2 TaxID=2811386 RepID=A0A898KD42_9VIRU|nr:virion protein [Haloarcula virus Hardyhisp2]QSJ05046.1 virion protein [Haloarcula virus Hardyhisp2]
MNIKKTFVGVMLALTVISSMAMPAAAAGTLYVGTSGTNEAVTYSTVENAVANATDGDTIEVAPGTYSESIEVNTANLTIQRDSSVSSGTVTINASGEKYGDAFYGESDSSLTLGTNVAVTENIVTVDSANTANADTYGTISDAMDNTTANSTISIAPGTYNESINVTSENVGFVNNAPNSGSVTIDATNTTEGMAFFGEHSDDVRVSGSVTIEESVLGIGGGQFEESVGNALTTNIFGIPFWAIAVVVLLAGYIYTAEE